MKQNRLITKSFLCLGVISAGLFQFSCKNFINGGLLKEEIEAEIEYANTPDVTVTVTCNNLYGTLEQTGGTYKLGTKGHELFLDVNDTYQFVKWQVYDSSGAETGCTAEDAIYIVEPESAETTYSILKEVENYKISAVCKVRPYVTTASPAYAGTGVSRDRSIIICFNEDIEESNFRYSEDEAAALETKGYELLKDSDDKAYGYSKDGIIYYKNIKIRDANDSSINMLDYFGIPEVSGTKVTITPKSGSGNQFELDSNGYKDIEVTVDDSVANDGIKMLNDYSWSYRVSNSTDAKTTVILSADTDYGTIVPSGTAEYNVGSEISVQFTEKENYKFIKWNLTENGTQTGTCAITDETYDEETGVSSAVITILEGNGNVSVSPECSARPQVASVSPQYQTTGVSRDRAVIINFNADIDKSYFRYSDDQAKELEEDGSTLLKDSDGYAYGYKKDGTIYYKNIKIRDANNSTLNLLGFFGAPEISGTKVTIAPKTGAKNQFELDSNGYKDIEVTVEDSVENDGTQMRSDYSWTYRVSSVTDSQTSVTVSADSDEGTVSPVGTAKYNVGDEISVQFTEKSGYRFIDWSLTETTAKTATCAVTSETYDETTGVSSAVITVMEGDGTVSLKPVCTQRPEISSTGPSYTAAGVNFSSAIAIDFAIPVEKENFIYSEDELSNFGDSAVAVRADASDETSDIIAIDIGDERYFKNISVTGADGESLTGHYKGAVLSEDRKSLRFYFDETKLFDFENSDTKSVYVTIPSTIYANYTKTDGTVVKVLMNDKGTASDFNFRIKNSSDTKANVTFIAMDGETRTGTLNYTGTQSFNLGETFTVTFEPASSYEFIKWSVTGNADGNIVATENGTKLTCTVNGAVDGVVISPVCEKLEGTSFLISVSNGNVTPNGNCTTYKEKDSFTLIYTPSDKYYFSHWKVVNTQNGEVLSEEKYKNYFNIEHPDSAETKVTIVSAGKNLSIVDESLIRPQVYAHDPESSSNGSVSRDSGIRLFLNHKIDEASLYYSESELNSLPSGASVLYGDAAKRLKPYGYVLNDNYYFKNIKITDRSDSTVNYLKYYGCPYLLDTTGLTVIIPVNIQYDTDGKIIQNLLPPAGKEILVTIGTEYGYYSEQNELVGLYDSNLVWAYTTDSSLDTTMPAIVQNENVKQITLKGKSYNVTKTYDLLESAIALPSTSVQSNVQLYRPYYLQPDDDGKLSFNLSLKAVDTGGNLSKVEMMMDKVLDTEYNDVSSSKITKSIELPLTMNISQGSYSGDIDFESDLGFDSSENHTDDGLYKVYFELSDQAGNVTNTSNSAFYYILIDRKCEASYTPRFFYKKDGTISVENVSPVKTFDAYTTTIIYKNNEVAVTVDNQSETITGLTVGESFEFKIVAEDYFNNKYEQTYTLTPGIHAPMALYSNGRFSTEYYEDLGVPYAFVYKVDDDGKIYVVTAETYRVIYSTIDNGKVLSVLTVPAYFTTYVNYSVPLDVDYQEIYKINDFMNTHGSHSLFYNNGSYISLPKNWWDNSNTQHYYHYNYLYLTGASKVRYGNTFGYVLYAPEENSSDYTENYKIYFADTYSNSSITEVNVKFISEYTGTGE